MIVEILLALFIFIAYFLFYVEYKINKNNEIYNYEKELTRQNINNDILLKMPFHFDASHLNSSLNTNNYKLIKKDKSTGIKEYNSIAENELLLLKPYIKSNLINKIYSIKSGGVFDIHANNESVNYYFVRDGSVEIFLIHPKFKDNFKTGEKSNNKVIKHYIENNTHFHNVKCTKGTIIYVPNEWFVYIKNNEKDICWIEKLTYSTMINKFMSYFKKNT